MSAWWRRCASEALPGTHGRAAGGALRPPRFPLRRLLQRGDASQDGEVPADRASLLGHRPEPLQRVGGCPAAARKASRGAAAGGGGQAGAASRGRAAAAAAGERVGAPPYRLRDLRRLQAGEYPALLEPEGDGGGGRDLLPGLDRRAGAADPRQGGAPGGAARGLDAPLPQAARRLPN